MANARSFLFPFRYSSRVAYVAEFSHQKIRLYAQGALVRDHGTGGDDDDDDDYFTDNIPDPQAAGENPAAAGGNPADTDGTGAAVAAAESGAADADDTYGIKIEITDNGAGLVTAGGDDDYPVLEIESPYTYGDLWDGDELCCKLQVIQHSDVMYIFSENHPIMVLKRYANDNWQLEELELLNGPFLSMNTTDIGIQCSGQSGTVTLTADDDIFSITDIGRLVRLRALNDDTKPWVAGENVAGMDIRLSDNKYYMSTTNGTTGSIKPVHSEGTRSDGGVSWTYMHDGIGVVKITGYTSGSVVTAQVQRRIPDAAMEGTVCWELGMLHSAAKYPKSGAFFRNRFAFLVNTDEGPNVCLSCSGDYNNFVDMENGEATAETAITVPVLNTEFNEGKWIYARDVLFVGTGAAEFYIDVISSSQALAADNVKIAQISNVGSKAVMPVAVGAHVFFADRYGLSLRDLVYNYYNDGYDQTDISLLGKHLFQARIVAMAYQEVPDKVLWCLTGDGKLAAMTFSAEQEVAALSRHDVSGDAESLAVIPDFDNCCDELWLEVRRTVGGKSLRTVERLGNGMPPALPAEVYDTGGIEAREEAESAYVLRQSVYLDAAVVFNRSADDTSTELSGLDHLNGQIVSVFADGAVRERQVVKDGKISIAASYTRVAAGLPVISQFIPQSIYIPNDYGSGIGQKQRINHVLLMLYRSGGGQIGADENSLRDILYRPADGVQNSPQPLFTGNKEILFNGATTQNEQAAQILIQNESPLPMNILALVPSLD